MCPRNHLVFKMLITTMFFRMAGLSLRGGGQGFSPATLIGK